MAVKKCIVCGHGVTEAEICPVCGNDMWRLRGSLAKATSEIRAGIVDRTQEILNAATALAEAAKAEGVTDALCRERRINYESKHAPAAVSRESAKIRCATIILDNLLENILKHPKIMEIDSELRSQIIAGVANAHNSLSEKD